MFTSCKEYHAMMAEKTVCRKNAKMFFSSNEKDLVDVSINNKIHRLLFDTGANATVIYHPKFNVEEKDKIRKKTIYGFHKKVKLEAYNYSIDSLQSDLFTTTNKFLYITEKEEDLCAGASPFDGILGSIVDPDYILELNYENGYVQYVDQFQKELYTELDAKFMGYTGMFTVNLEINGIRDNFLFDTGNKTVTLLNTQVYKNLGEKFYTIKSLSQSVGNSLIPVDIDIYKASFKLDNQLEFDFPVGTDKALGKSLLNKNFIEKFNWFIDAKNNKVYCKPINAEKLLQKKEMKKTHIILTNVFDQKLLVSYMNFDSQYHLGSEIVAVKGQKITSENICDIQKLLNNNSDWNAMKIEIATTHH
jgi:predicted aspartyl protease